MSFLYEDNANPSGDNGHYFYGTKEAQFFTCTPGDDHDHNFYETEEAQFSTCTSSFYTDEVFGSREDMMNWVKHTAYSLGYVIVTKISKQCKNSLTNKLVLMCDRGGKPRGSSTNTSSKKTNCPFKLVAKYSLEHRYWTIRVVCDQHNHRPTVNLEGHAYARRLSKDEFPPKSIQSVRVFGVNLNIEPERHSFYTNYQTNYDRDPIPNLNEEPARHSLFVDLNEEPTTFFDYIPETNLFVPPTVESHSLFVDLNEEHVTNPLLDHIPEIFHRYIIQLNNVKGDGNCGFRSVAVGLGRDENMWPLIRQELLQELRYHEHDYMEILTSTDFKFIWDTVNFVGTGFAPIDKWMSMPDTGLVIASFYKRPVVFISMVGNDVLSSTCFPLWSGPHESESTEPIVVARVGGSHFINLLLRVGYPIPSTHPQWRRYRIDSASAWEDMYSSRQLAFEEYIHS
uniref:OTU domain-containing protein n=1 Tax=Tanacetum cinerariifolium TaxID=118510 RepID=A0A699H1N3_TANCI|nr:hypothetical protein [Tanacetum cinerariifolium]